MLAILRPIPLQVVGSSGKRERKATLNEMDGCGVVLCIVRF